MSDRVEVIDNHPSHQLVETLVGRLRALEPPEEQAEGVGRMLEVLAYVQRLLRAADRGLLSAQFLDPLTEIVQAG